MVVYQLEKPRHTGRYILYQDQDVIRDIGFSCDTPDDGVGYTRDELPR
ncbi:MAG: hypothetical protein H6559_20065 [Lewinellaceae bacterium]|nr:hypothetical protein [Lewinellaceae bacterium]